MQKLTLLVIMIPVWMGCSNNDDDEIDCQLFDPAFPSLFIRLVDASGNNLIENGTIDPDNMSVHGDFPYPGFQFIPANEFANPDAEFRELDNTIRLFIPNESAFLYTVHLGNTDDIQVEFSAELTRIPCNLSYFKPIEGVFNSETFELRELSSLQFLAILEL